MSQLSLNQTITSFVTDSEPAQKKGILKNSEICPKKRPDSAFSSKNGNDDNASVGAGGDFSRVRKLGHLPSYLKKQTKSSVESELFSKYKKFKIAKKELVELQSNFKKDFEHLRVLKDKLKQFGGRDFKMENLELIEFTGGGNDSGCGDGAQYMKIGDASKPSSRSVNNQIFDFEREIQRIRGRVKDCLSKLIDMNSDAYKQIQSSGNAELQDKINEIFSKVDEYLKSVNDEQDTSLQHILENLQQLRIPMPQEMEPTNKRTLQEEEIVGLKKAVQSLEIQGKMLQSEVDVKSQEIEYLKNKELAYSKSKQNFINNITTDTDAIELHSPISTQKDIIIDNFREKLEEHLKLQEIYEQKIRHLEDLAGKQNHQKEEIEHLKQLEVFKEKIKQLEDKLEQQNHQMEENLLRFKSDLSEERKKYEELGKTLDETTNANSMILRKCGDSSFELMSNQLVAANEDIKELQFKVVKREKQIQNLKQFINSDANRMKEYDQLLCRYEELRQQDQYRSKEMLQLKDKLVVRTNTINSQSATISELNKRLMHQGARGAIDHSNDNYSPDSLQEEQKSKFSEHERIIKKLENNKIRSNVLRDQLLDRISVLETEKEDMKAQIRKFHEDFTINRFMYDEQRRKKRLTEILVKQYQK